MAFRASFAPGSINTEKRTLDLVWSTGAKVLRQSYWDGASYEELSMDPAHVRLGRLNSGAPLLSDHRGDTKSVRGVVESARIEGGKGIATVRFPAEGIDPESDRLFALARDGILQNISVGYRTYKTEKVEVADEKVPTFRAVDWEPHEISVVAIGADPDAHFRSDQSTQHNECVFVTRGVEAVTTDNEAEKTRLTEIQAAKEEATRLERERVSGIQSAVRVSKLDEKFAQSLIDSGATIEKAREAVLNELAKRSEETPHVTVHAVTGGDARDKFFDGASAWAFERAGTRGQAVVLAHKRGVLGFEKVAIDGGQFRGMTLVDLARECLERSGVSTRGIFDRNRIFDMALRTRGYQGRADFSVLLENVLYKVMRANYALQADTWRRFCSTEEVADFRDATFYSRGSFGTLPVVGENEEYQMLEIPDGAKISVNVETRGAMIGLSRQALINDDMGALVATAGSFGETAGNSIEDAVYTQLQLNTGAGPTMSDSNPLFHSSRNNISTSAALSVAALDADRLKMRQQLDISGNRYLDLMPRILLVPIGLESAARIINESANDYTSSSDSSKPNPVRGMFGDIVSSPRLSGSTTRRYLFTEAKEALKVVFLSGAGQGPRMESQQGFEVDGTKWKVSIDFKVNPFEPKSAIMNAGV